MCNRGLIFGQEILEPVMVEAGDNKLVAFNPHFRYGVCGNKVDGKRIILETVP